MKSHQTQFNITPVNIALSARCPHIGKSDYTVLVVSSEKLLIWLHLSEQNNNEVCVHTQCIDVLLFWSFSSFVFVILGSILI